MANNNEIVNDLSLHFDNLNQNLNTDPNIEDINWLQEFNNFFGTNQDLNLTDDFINDIENFANAIEEEDNLAEYIIDRLHPDEFRRNNNELFNNARIHYNNHRWDADEFMYQTYEEYYNDRAQEEREREEREREEREREERYNINAGPMVAPVRNLFWAFNNNDSSDEEEEDNLLEYIIDEDYFPVEAEAISAN
jgi:hypothetical protein